MEQVETAEFAAHIEAAVACVERALERAREQGSDFAGVVFHAGSQRYYHADDRPIPFKPAAHFARFAPLATPGHTVVVEPGKTPKLIQVVPRDFWHETPAPLEHPYRDVLEVVEVAAAGDVRAHLGAVKDLAFVGADHDLARSWGVRMIEPPSLLAALDWERAVKTAYEVGQIEAAARRAALGHAAVRRGVDQGRSERQLLADYLEATGHLGNETPYGSIIAWDEASAVLHYTAKRTTAPTPGHTFLIDAGAQVHGYASDITRTYTREGTPKPFVDAVAAMETLQNTLVQGVFPGTEYVDLHETSVKGVTSVLCQLGVITVPLDEAYQRQLGLPFYPHGLGHHIGLQVHDVGGHQVSPQGERRDPPEAHPFLRTTRPLEAGHVVTIEPGLYFIPMLLDPVREGPHAESFDWELIDRLIPCGGIRIEDDVFCSAQGPRNLSRPHVP